MRSAITGCIGKKTMTDERKEGLRAPQAEAMRRHTARTKQNRTPNHRRTMLASETDAHDDERGRHRYLKGRTPEPTKAASPYPKKPAGRKPAETRQRCNDPTRPTRTSAIALSPTIDKDLAGCCKVTCSCRSPEGLDFDGF
jgi:hypothetical protein